MGYNIVLFFNCNKTSKTSKLCFVKFYIKGKMNQTPKNDCFDPFFVSFAYIFSRGQNLAQCLNEKCSEYKGIVEMSYLMRGGWVQIFQLENSFIIRRAAKNRKI